MNKTEVYFHPYGPGRQSATAANVAFEVGISIEGRWMDVNVISGIDFDATFTFTAFTGETGETGHERARALVLALRDACTRALNPTLLEPEEGAG